MADSGHDRVRVPVPEGSDRMKEMAKTIQYCKDALLA